ncbi:6-phosphofructo-2-kinase-domain-containing protein [Mrakia frigida]|uniref:fructose-2,6-bisphosphatase n=1 Tax=Mrakia frigida TaxID=29902 RepID=UPI003FCBFC12
MPDRDFTPAKHSSLRQAVSQMESLRLSSTPPETSKESSAASSTNISETSSPAEHRGRPGVAADEDNGPNAAMKIEMPAPTPFYGATGPALTDLDTTTRLSRKNSRAPTRAPSVTGIGMTVQKPDYSEAKIVVAMVGLPARGKSFLSNKLMRYLQWLEYKVKVFNVGQLRRRKARDDYPEGTVDHSASYFNHSDPDAKAVRESLAEESLESLIKWLKREGNVGILDATNTTKERRAKIEARVSLEPNLHLLFLESVCDEPAVIAANIALKVSSGDPDYKDMTKEAAEIDFRKRIAQYESVYEPVSEPHLSYCKVVNVGRTVHINRINGYLESRVAFYLMNLHLKPRAIFLSRHGESMYNVQGKIGGDAELSPRGQMYAKALPSLILDAVGDSPLNVWTSTMRRTIQTAQHLPYPKKTWKSLDELDGGVCDGMTYEEIEERYPEDYAARDSDKYDYRYRGGESYRDVVVRLEPVIMELERQENILVIGHQAIIRCLYAYFLGYPQDQLPYISVPLHTLIKITPKAYGCDEERFSLPIPAVDTHRPRPGSRRPSPATTPRVIGTPQLASLSQAIADSGKEFVPPATAREYFGEGADSLATPAVSPVHDTPKKA